MLLIALLACNDEPWTVEFEDGTYVAREASDGDTGDTGTAAGEPVVAKVDTVAHTLVLTWGDEEVGFDFTSWGDDDWPTGCPTNVDVAHMEAASLDPAAFDLGGLHYTDAAIFSLCPSGAGLGLAEASDVRGLGEGDKCDAGTCVYFDP